VFTRQFEQRQKSKKQNRAPDTVAKPKTENEISNSRLHRAKFEQKLDKDYLHMDAIVSQLGDLKISEVKSGTSLLTGIPREDYLQMDSIEFQLDPQVKAQGAALVRKTPEANVFSRLVIPETSFLSADGVRLENASTVEKSQVNASNNPALASRVPVSKFENTAVTYCIVKKGASTSRIARDVCSGPLYDEEEGCLAKFLAMNPVVEDPDLIFPGQKLIIPQARSSSGCEGEMVPPLRLPASEDVVKTEPATNQTPAPTPTPTAIPTPMPSPTPAWKPHSEFGLGIAPSFLRIDSVDAVTYAPATFLSNLNLGVNAKWVQDWSPKFSTEFLFTMLNATMTSVSNRQINDPTFSLLGFGIGAHSNLSDAFKIGGYLRSQQQIFIRSTSLTVTTLDQIAVPQADAEGVWRVAEINPLSFDLVGRGSYYFPSTTDFYGIKPGWGYLLKGQLTQEFEKMRVQGGIGYQMQYQNTSIASQTETYLLFDFNVSASF